MPAGRGPRYACYVPPLSAHARESGHPVLVTPGSRLRGDERSILSRLFFLLRRTQGAGVFDFRNFVGLEAEHIGQYLVGMLAQQRRALHLGDRIGQFDRIADAQIFSAGRVIDLDHRTGLAQRLVLGDLLHRQNRPDRNIDRIADVHDLELGLGHGPLLDGGEDGFQLRQPRLRRDVIRIGFPFRLADHVADRAPRRRLGDEISVGVGIALPAFALEDPAGLAAAGVVAGARHRLAERNALAVLAVFGERAFRDALLVAQLNARKIEHAVLHGAEHLLAAAGAVALIKRRYDAKRQMQSGAAVADLRTGDRRRTFAEAGGGGGAACALRDVLVHLAVLVGPGAETLDRGDDHARIELVDVVPGQPHAVERAGGEVLHQHVARLDQRIEHAHALRVLGVDGDRAFVVVEHGEIEAVGARHVAQLSARDVADTRTLDLNHVGADSLYFTMLN